MKKLIGLVLYFGMLITGLEAQEVDANDRVNIVQGDKPYIGVFAFGYQGSANPGYPQFQLNNFGGLPNTPLSTNDNSILGSFAFSGYDGNAKKTVGVLRVKTMDDYANSLSSRMDFLLGPNREQRMTIIGNSGYVGINTDNPSTTLDVDGRIRMRSGANEGFVPTSDNEGNMTWTHPDSVNLMRTTSNGLGLYNPKPRLGLGTDNPNAALHLVADSDYFTSGIRMTTSGLTNEDWYIFMDPEDDLVFRNDVNNTLVLEANTQHVGINVDDPDTYLHVEGDLDESNNIFWAKSNYTGGITGSVAIKGTSNNVPGKGIGGVFEGGYRGVTSSVDIGDYSYNAHGIYSIISGTVSNSASRTSLYGIANTSSDNYGLNAYAYQGDDNYAIYASTFGYSGPSTYAGYFAGAVHVTGNFTNPSDKKLKKGIKQHDQVMEDILQLDVKSYTYDTKKYPYMGLPDGKQVGFIAQELGEVFPHLIHQIKQPAEYEKGNNGHQNKLIAEEEYYKGINYIGMIPILTKGLQELDEELSEKEERIEQLINKTEEQDKEIAELREMIMELREEKSHSDISDERLDNNKWVIGTSKFTLSQNQPNPFGISTKIDLYIPNDVGNAFMEISNSNGTVLAKRILSVGGKSTIEIDASSLATGNYHYSLYLDGRLVETKTMIIVR